jgi:tetratricopeptide (TPR) repeat protein
MRWFITPSRILWTRETASYRGEELFARIAVATYLDAAVGWPDKTVLAQAAEGLNGAEKVVKEGSQRVSMEDLGRSVGSPNLGRAAVLVGDRAALLGRFDEWTDWHVRLHTLRAALTEGDLPLALRAAKRYAEFDPRDEDLRIGVAALLCLGEDAKRGLELMTSAQDDRATRRYAAMARDWGDVRLLIVACAARAGLTPPPRPEAPEAGQGNKLEARAALRLRLIAAEGSGAAATPPTSEGAAGGGSRSMPGDGPNSVADRDRQAVTWAAELLAAGVSDPRARLALLALVVGSPYPPSPAQTVDLVPRLDEPQLARPEAMTALDWLLEARGLRPIAPAPAIKRAAERLLEMAGSTELDAPSAAALRAAAGALWMEAGKALALAGEIDQALAAFDRGSSEAQWSKPTLALARSSAWAMAGDIAAALAEIDALSPEFRAPPSSDKPRTSTETAVLAALLLQRAELLAMAPPPADEPSRATRKKLLAQAALDADLAASASKIAKLDARARWMRLAFVRAPDGSPLRPGTEIDAAQIIPPRTWPWVGEIPTQETQPPSLGSSGAPLLAGESSLERRWEGPLARSLAAWNAAIAASPPERLAFRYALLSVRGDVVPAPLAYLSLATELLAGQGSAEVWLDAVMAPGSRSISHRMFAWSRWQAALRRGDLERATEWRRRFETLRAIASDPARAEIAAFLGI